jgi:uncharacterized protein YqhQ
MNEPVWPLTAAQRTGVASRIGTASRMGLASRMGPASRMGGIALKNGLIVVSERHWAAAIREAGGDISVASGKKPRLPVGGGRADGPQGVPLLRGLGRFGESLLVLAVAKSRLPGAELPLQGGRVAAALAGSVAAASAVKRLAPKSALVQEAGSALATFIPAILALKNSPISGYHGAEHKVIGGREAALRDVARGLAGWALPGAADSGATEPVADSIAGSTAAQAGATHAGAAHARASAASKEHDRCGSNLVGPYLLATVATNLVARGRSGKKSPAASAVAGAVSLGIALEALRWATNNGDSLLARLMLLPGRAIQKRLTTTEPTADQLEVGERAMAELLRLEKAAG